MIDCQLIFAQTQPNINDLIRDLSNSDYEIRNKATGKLIYRGESVRPYIEECAKTNTDGETLERVKIILKSLELFNKYQFTFSEELLEWYPEIYLDFENENVATKVKVLTRITEVDSRKKPKHLVAEKDIAFIVDELLRSCGADLDETCKIDIFMIVTGTIMTHQEDGVDVTNGWGTKIPVNANTIAGFLHDESIAVRTIAISVLTDIKANEYLDFFVKLLSDENSIIRAKAAIAVGKLGEFETVKLIVPLLSDEESLVRVDAISAIKYANAKDLISHVVPLLKDKELLVRLNAISAIVNFEAKEYKNDILELLDDPEDIVKSSAIDAVGKLNMTEAVLELCQLLNNENVLIRSRVLSTLGLLKARSAIDDIKKELHDENWYIKGWAIIVLTELGEERIVPKESIESLKRIYNQLLILEGLEGEDGKRVITAFRKLGVSENDIENIRTVNKKKE